MAAILPRTIWKSAAVEADALAWLGGAETLLFCDRNAGCISGIALADFSVTETYVGGRPGLVFPTEDGRLLFASERDILVLGAEAELRREMPIDTYRVNDASIGTVDANGRLWFGMEDRQVEQRRGGLFRYHDERLVPMLFDQVRPGGVAVTADAATLYQAIASEGRIDRHDVNRAGALSNGVTFIELPEGSGEPRGLALDLAGNLWVALDGTGCVRQYSAAGRCVDEISIPHGQPRDLAFGGNDLTTLFVAAADGAGGSAIHAVEKLSAGQAIAPVRLSNGAHLGLIDDDDH